MELQIWEGLSDREVIYRIAIALFWLGSLISSIFYTFKLLSKPDEFRNSEEAVEAAVRRIKNPKRPWKKHLRSKNQETREKALQSYQDRLKDVAEARRQVANGERTRIFCNSLLLLFFAAILPGMLFWIALVGWSWFVPNEQLLLVFDSNGKSKELTDTIALKFVWHQLAVAFDFYRTDILMGHCRIGELAFDASRIRYGLIVYQLLLVYGAMVAVEYLRRSYFVAYRVLMEAMGKVGGDPEIMRMINMTLGQLGDHLKSKGYYGSGLHPFRKWGQF